MSEGEKQPKVGNLTELYLVLHENECCGVKEAGNRGIVQKDHQSLAIPRLFDQLDILGGELVECKLELSKGWLDRGGFTVGASAALVGLRCV